LAALQTSLNTAHFTSPQQYYRIVPALCPGQPFLVLKMKCDLFKKKKLILIHPKCHIISLIFLNPSLILNLALLQGGREWGQGVFKLENIQKQH